MKRFFFLISAILMIASCTYEKGAVPVKDDECDSTISYSTQITPLVTTYCLSCHVAGGTGSGDFSTYAGIKLKADNGSLKNRVIVLRDMPPAGSPQLSDEERMRINCWIKQGAPDN